MTMMRGLMVLALAGLAGCWTIRESEPPNVTVSALPANRSVRVQLAGFDALMTTYEAAYGYATVIGGTSWYDCHGWRHSGIGTTTYTTTEFIPQTSATSYFRDRASDTLERCGFILQTQDPQYRIEVRFEGPYRQDSDAWATAGWMIFTLLTADYGAQEWTAKLKVHDLKTGKLVYEKEYLQRYEALVWGPVPIFSPAFSDKTSVNVMKSWCLSVLTDLTVADAVKFLSEKVSRQFR